MVGAGTDATGEWVRRGRSEALATDTAAWHSMGMPIEPNMTEPADGASSAPETESERARRLGHEAELVAQGRADVAAGRIVSGEAVETWISESVRLGRPAERPRSEPRLASKAG